MDIKGRGCIIIGKTGLKQCSEANTSFILTEYIFTLVLSVEIDVCLVTCSCANSEDRNEDDIR